MRTILLSLAAIALAGCEGDYYVRHEPQAATYSYSTTTEPVYEYSNPYYTPYYVTPYYSSPYYTHNEIIVKNQRRGNRYHYRHDRKLEHDMNH